ncbi:MAG: L-aspartate oxidase [Acidobacteriota bacterium]
MATDFIIIGAGIAGIRAALELAAHGEVFVLTKSRTEESNTEYAQGGVAVAMSADDTVDLHLQDTLAAGAGLCLESSVRTLVEEGPDRIRELIEWGTAFDLQAGELAFSREAAHSRHRILHARGDSTGREIQRTLIQAVRELPSVHLLSHSFAQDLLVKDGVCSGVQYLDEPSGEVRQLEGQSVLLATGGMGVLYPTTTNPSIATGDGCALAFGAGASVADMEFVQFHPTVLKLEGAPPFLLSEALRGEGACLRNARGDQFMSRYHPQGDLATRDVVSRSILSECQESGSASAFLDATVIDSTLVEKRFPYIFETCLNFGLDIRKEFIPVYPAAHYMMGGVLTDWEGRTTLPGLFAAGETASNGVHGANRLASNSLLEGLVFGARTGRSMAQGRTPCKPLQSQPLETSPWPGAISNSDNDSAGTDPELRERIQRMADQQVGVIRNSEQLQQTVQQLQQIPSGEGHLRQEQETRHLFTNLRLIAGMALLREESRGAHFRSDYPARDDQQWQRRITAQLDVERDQMHYATIPVDGAPETTGSPSGQA